MRKGKLEKEILMASALVVLAYVVYQYYEKSKEHPFEKGCRNAFQKMLIYRNTQQDMKPDWFGTEEHYERYKLTDC